MKFRFGLLSLVPVLTLCCTSKSGGGAAQKEKASPAAAEISGAEDAAEARVDASGDGLDGLVLSPHGDYDKIRESMIRRRAAFAASYAAADGDTAKARIRSEAGEYLAAMLVDSLIPFWYGTEWTFGGHTEVPVTGSIACGYFVSTSLRHAGFNLDRFKLAQQSPKMEALSIHLSDSISTYRGVTPKKLKALLASRAPGLYFVGLDFHVGFLYKRRDGNLFFIHSNYIGAVGVMAERVERSEAFRSSKYFIAAITTNERLVERWILNGKIEIRRS